MDRRTFLRVAAGAGLAPAAGCPELERGRSDRGPRIEAPDSAMVDEELDLAVAGLADADRVRIEASVEDGRGRSWTAEGTFEPVDGRVDPSTEAPVEGTYEGAAGMGLFWSMEPEASGSTRFYDATHPTQTVSLRAISGAENSAPTGTTIDRHVRHPDSEETEHVDPIVGTLVESPGRGPSPGVLLLHGSAGIRTVPEARTLAGHGFTVLALQYFSQEHDSLPDALVEVPVEYADRAVEWLSDHEAVSGGPIGVGGFSRGGELAMLLGARHDATGTVVNWAGAGILFNAFVWGGETPDTSAWSLDGEPLPHPDLDDVEYAKSLRESYEQWLAATPTDTLRAAEVDLGAIDGPILLISAGEDGIWPSRFLSNRVENRLDDLGYDHAYEHLTYDGSGHGIGVPYLPTWPNRPGGMLGGTRAATAAASADSWPRAIEFFERGAPG